MTLPLRSSSCTARSVRQLIPLRNRPTETRIGDSVVLVSASGEREIFPAFLYIYVDDADGTYRRALAAGAVSVEEPWDTPYGDRRAMVRDVFGNLYQIATRNDTATP